MSSDRGPESLYRDACNRLTDADLAETARIWRILLCIERRMRNEPDLLFENYLRMRVGRVPNAVSKEKELGSLLYEP